MTDAVLSRLEQRLGRLHARQRLGIETDHEAQVFGQGLTDIVRHAIWEIDNLAAQAVASGDAAGDSA
jgi:hypothetical protein